MPAQEHPSHTLHPFTRSRQGICADDSLDVTFRSARASSHNATSARLISSRTITVKDSLFTTVSSTGDMSVINLTEGAVQRSSGSSTLRSDNRMDRHQKSDPIPSANDFRANESSHHALKKKQSMPAITSTSGSGSGATSVPSKDGKDIKKTRKLWSGFGGSSSSSSSPSQTLISEPLAIGHPSSASPPDPRATPGLSRSIDTNNPWFKDLILISSPPKPSSIHSATSIPTSTSSSKKVSSRGFTSKSMVSLSKSSTPLDLVLPPPPSHSHLQEFRDSVSLNRARSPSISILESSPRHSIVPTNVNASAITPQSPKLLSFSRQHHQGLEPFMSDPIPSVGDLLTGFSNDEDSLKEQLPTTSLTGSRRCKSGPIPTPTATAPLSPRLPAWTRFGDKSQAQKYSNWCVDPEVQTLLHDDVRGRSSYHAQDFGQQHSPSMKYIAGVSRHILAPVELAQAMEQEEEEARRLKQSREKQGEGRVVSEQDAPPPLPLRRGLTMRQSPASEPSSLDIASKKQEAGDKNPAPEAITVDSPADEILLSAISAKVSVDPPLQVKASVVSMPGLMPQEPRRLSVSITAVSTVAHAQVLKTSSQSSPPPTIPRRSPHRGPLSPILKDL
ncbi:hypothetical protein BGZ82_008021 [Podila clonocystis]|nr:hypothetical protein BGZ82_008021 [Podila clonocystis]